MKSILGISIVSFIGFSFCIGAPFWIGDTNDTDSKFPFSQPDDPTERIACEGNTDLGNCVSIKEDEDKPGEETVIRRLLGVFGLDNSKGRDLKFIDYVKAILNMALGLLSMVALVMTIYTFYIMFFTENEDGAKKAKQNLIGIFIALAIIGLAWLIVSFIFWRYNENWLYKNDEIEKANITMADHRLNDQIYLNV